MTARWNHYHADGPLFFEEKSLGDRAAEIRLMKPERQWATRINALREVKGKLPPRLVEAGAARSKAGDAWLKADAAWLKADAALSKADAARSKAYAALSKADAAWSKADAAWSKADAARSKAYAALSKAYAALSKADAAWSKACAAWLEACAKHGPQIKALYEQECHDVPYNWDTRRLVYIDGDRKGQDMEDAP